MLAAATLPPVPIAQGKRERYTKKPRCISAQTRRIAALRDNALASHSYAMARKRRRIDTMIDAHVWMRRQEAKAPPGSTMWPMESPLHRYLADIHYAVNATAFYSALALALAIPDICGAIEFPDEQAVGRRYRDWFESWCGLMQSYVGAADCYAIRCSYLHEGIQEFGGRSTIDATLSHIQFTVGMGGGGWSYTNIAAAPGSDAKPAVRIPVELFCRDMTTSADAWRRSRASDPRTALALSRLIEFRNAS
jgi:hypothetical protein